MCVREPFAVIRSSAMWPLVLLSAAVVVAAAATRAPSIISQDEYHPQTDAYIAHNVDDAELDAAHWNRLGQEAIESRKYGVHQDGAAKNVIFYLGDGMSVPTLAGARTLLGQLNQRTGEETQLSFEKFPVVGLSKTYCVNNQVADSACSATAYLCGVKANLGTLGVTARVARGNCSASLEEGARVRSMAAWALAAGKDVGIVTTTRITHASPAGTYAHSADRGWEAHAPHDDCYDIAHQLVHHNPGKQFKVILGGGRRNFRQSDGGQRVDGRDLTEEWLADKAERNVSAAYVENLEQLRDVDLNGTDYLLGLFSENHAPYDAERNEQMDPSLSELTQAALHILKRSENGFFLFVEGGRIDHAHHDNRAELAMLETIEFANAVEKADSLEDTLVVVTADHSHVMAFNGYSQRGRDVLGPARDLDRDRVPYMILSYTNGPGFRAHNAAGTRDDPTAEATFETLRWRSHVDVPRSSETHGGEDVPVFARGPQQHMFTGLYEQSHLPHLVGYAACFGPGKQAAPCVDAAHTQLAFLPLLIALAFVATFRPYL